MFRSLAVWFRRTQRPSIPTIGVHLYVNGKPEDITTYSDQKLRSLVDAIDYLWKENKQSQYWFETEIHRKGFFFTKKTLTLQVTCYSQKPDSIEKIKYDIPIAIRKKMFDKLFRIQPILNGKVWTNVVEVKFTNKSL